MQKGMTYMVRPRMQPSKRAINFSFLSAGFTQLLVGPASDLLREQIKVRLSIRATSLGSERLRKQFGRFSSFRRMKVPLSTISLQRLLYSSCEPSQI